MLDPKKYERIIRDLEKDEYDGSEEEVSYLIRVLEDGKNSDDVRGRAATALGDIGDNKSFNSLNNAIKDKSSFVREEAATALGNIGDKRAVISLIKALKDNEKNVRLSAVVALGEIPDKRTVIPLIKVLRDRDDETRGEAARALGIIHDKRAVLPLINALKDKSATVRYFAASAFRILKDKKAIEPLIGLLNDEHSVVEVTLKAIATVGKPSVNPLINTLQDKCKDNVIRARAAWLLGRIGKETGDKRSLRPLIQCLKEGKEERVRAACAESLGKLNDLTAIESLIQALGDKSKDVSVNAAESIGSIYETTKSQKIIDLLKMQSSNLTLLKQNLDKKTALYKKIK